MGLETVSSTLFYFIMSIFSDSTNISNVSQSIKMTKKWSSNLDIFSVLCEPVSNLKPEWFLTTKLHHQHDKAVKTNRGHPGLNRGPLDLQSNALPLSYIPFSKYASTTGLIFANQTAPPRSKQEIKQSKQSGDTRDWTRDLSIYSRMLYHWAISPWMQVVVHPLHFLLFFFYS